MADPNPIPPATVLPSSHAGEVPSPRPVVKPIPRWVIALGFPAMVLVAVTATWLLLGFGVDGAKLDAIRTGGTLGVGLGGAVALWLATRKQRSTELELLQKYEAHQLQQQVAIDARDDAVARRINDLYAQAVDQLGSDQAAVRLGGLYALERLGQNHSVSRLRQTIVNVICAYLRMPYIPLHSRMSQPLGRRRTVRPGGPLPPARRPDGQESTAADVKAAKQEREVRLTAQRILEAHLRVGHNPSDPPETFWANITLDLTEAVLIDVDLSNCRIDGGSFRGATFVGNARLAEASFTAGSDFSRTHFIGWVVFRDVSFTSDTSFNGARFADAAVFSNARFLDGGAFFVQANFAGDAEFDNVTFTERIQFENMHWHAGPSFGNAIFAKEAKFDGMIIKKNTTFEGENVRRLPPSFRSAKFMRGVPDPLKQYVGNESGDE